MPNLQLFVNFRRQFGVVPGALPGPTATGFRSVPGLGGKRALRKIINWLEAIASSQVQADQLNYSVNDTTTLGDAAYSGPAVGAMVLSGGAGAVGPTIDGTAATQVFAVSDTATMTAIVNGINALTTNNINQKVGAANFVTQLTMGTPAAGITVDIWGIRFTATAAAPTNFGEFDRSSGVAATIATSLALAINRHPSLAGRCRAVANSAVVYVGLLENRLAQPGEAITNAGTGITINTAVPTVGPIGLVYCSDWGVIGNCVTVTGAGTGFTYVTSNAGKLGSGTGGGTSDVLVTP